MYAALWRKLPGSFWVKVSILAGAAIVVTGVLMLFVFPWIDGLMASQQSVVGQ